MKWTDEELMAYADGELAIERRVALDDALRYDAQLHDRVRTLQAQRQRISAAFASVLEEPVPDRLTALLAAPATEAPPPPVVDLAAERERRNNVRRSLPSWAQWGGMAASVVLGVAIGMQINGLGTPSAGDALVSEAGGRLVAGGQLAQALNGQLAGDAAAGSTAPVAVPVSFIDKDGQYCRAFSTERLAGLACRDASHWTIQTATGPERAMSGEMRQASSPLPRAVLEAIDARMTGSALNSAQEQQARDRAWLR